MKSFSLILIMSVFLFSGLVRANAQEKEKKNKDGVYLVVDEMPEYPGGEVALRNDIANKIVYPEDAKKAGTQGKVYITFVVDEKGQVTDAKVARGVDKSLDAEALKVVKKLKTWTPGKDKGKPVKVSYTIPIQFALDNKKEKEE